MTLESLKLNYPITVISNKTPINLFDLLHASDWIITCLSTTSLDSLAVGTPVLTVTLDRKARRADRYTDLERYGLPVVSTSRELTRQLEGWIRDPNRRAQVQSAAQNAAEALLANYPRGDAGERIVNVLSPIMQIEPNVAKVEGTASPRRPRLKL